jgi:alpha-1,3-mannosyltransferase
VVFKIYRLTDAPGWLLGLCVLSKRVHSIFMLRLFNDGLAQLMLYMSLLLLLQGKHTRASIIYSCSIGMKLQPLFYCPAFGLCLVLAGGWSHLLLHVCLMLLVQVVGALPFLLANPLAYVSRAFGGPGALQKAWSVNWKCVPSDVFFHPYFPVVLACSTLMCLAWFAHFRWTPNGIAHTNLWKWSGSEPRVRMLDSKNMLTLLFSCNFIIIALLRTMHFQFLVWYFHTLPFLAWVTLDSVLGGTEHSQQGWRWVVKAVLVATCTIGVEIPFLLTTTGLVKGPDGREWESPGVPTSFGSMILLCVHTTLLLLLVALPRLQWDKGRIKSD